MKIFRCIKPKRISQPFGVNYVGYYKMMGLKGHNGIDFACPMYTKVYWDGSIKGKVVKVTLSATSGFGVSIATEKDENLLHIFWHMACVIVKPGQIVGTGDLLGTADSTGQYCTGPHVHRGIYKTKNGHTIDRDNGYGGAIDPAQYLEDVFVLDKMKSLETTIALLKIKIINLMKAISLYRSKGR